MKVETLVVTMHQEDCTLVEKMNLRSAVVVANQGETTAYEEKNLNGCNCKMISTSTRGVGVNRNLALTYASGDIIVIADDDMKYYNDYPSLVAKAFEENPQADLLIFNIKGCPHIHKKKKVRWYNFMRYGAVRIAMRLTAQRMSNVWFSTMFGGGAKYSAGEDSLFLAECLKHKLKIYAVPVEIGALLNDRGSTWFNGHNEKYFYDKGVLYATMSKKFAYLLGLQFLLRHKRQMKEIGVKASVQNMFQGVKAGKKRGVKW